MEHLLNKEKCETTLKKHTTGAHVLQKPQKGPMCLITTGTLRGQGRPNGRWPWGHWILSRLIFSPPGSGWKSRRGLFFQHAVKVRTWWWTRDAQPLPPTSQGPRSTLGNETLLRGGRKFQATQSSVVWVSNVPSYFFFFFKDFKTLMKTKRRDTSTGQ